MESVSRLIRTFAPEHYTLSINLHRIERTFSGTVAIEGVAPQDTEESRLHAKDLSIQSVQIDGKSANFAEASNDELIITQQIITAGTHIVTVSFEGNITDDMNGIYPVLL